MKKMIKHVHKHINKQIKKVGNHIIKHKKKYLGLVIACKLAIIGFGIGFGIQMLKESYAADNGKTTITTQTSESTTNGGTTNLNK